MAFVGALWVVLAWTWVQLLPGYVLSRVLIPEARGAARHGLALVCAFSVVPLVVFLLAVAGSMPMDGPLLWSVSSAVNLGGAILLRPWRRLDIGWRDTGLLAAAGVAASLWIIFGLRSLDGSGGLRGNKRSEYEGGIRVPGLARWPGKIKPGTVSDVPVMGSDVFSTVHHCLYVIVMHTLQNDPSTALPLYDGLSDGPIHYLVNHPTTEFNGLAPLFFEQRLGNAAILAPAVALFGTMGWLVTTVFATLVAGTSVYNGARALNARPAAAGIGAVLFAIGAHTFCAYFVNENYYAIALVAFLCWGAVRQETTVGWVALMGLVAGHLVGVRYTSSLFWPAVIAAALWRGLPWRRRLGHLALGGALAALCTLPWLYVNTIMLGSPFSHPKIGAESQARVVTNEIAGHSFQFRALNWPFTDQVVRTPWNPFPTVLWLPLWVGLCFGQLGVAIALLGWMRLFRRGPPRRAFWLLLLFAVPHTAAIAWLETLDWEQLTYAAPGLVPLGLVLCVGVDGLLEPVRRWRRVAIVAGLLVALTGLSWAVRPLRLPPDTRLLPPAEWPEPPPPDRGTEAVAERLTAFSPLPKLPVWRTRFAHWTLGALRHALPSRPVPAPDGIPMYPSGRVALLAGYSPEEAPRYRFMLEGGPLRTADTPVRSSLGLHLIALRYPAERMQVDIVRDRGNYRIDLKATGTTTEPRDFSMWLHPWYPPVRSIVVTREGGLFENLRTLTYGGTAEDGEQRVIVTNYPKDILDVVDIPYTVDTHGETVHCGLFLYIAEVDHRRIETLALAGGHDQTWHGTTSGVIRLPRGARSDRILLYSEPYCSDHVPQYGDRYGVVHGPFTPDRPLHFVLDGLW